MDDFTDATNSANKDNSNQKQVNISPNNNINNTNANANKNNTSVNTSASNKVNSKNDNASGASKAVDKTGKAVENTGKTVKNTGKAVKAAGKVTQIAGKTAKVAGKGAKVAGKGAQAAGKGVKAASNAAGAAMSAIPIVGTALGAATKAAGTAAGTGAEAAGKGTEVAGKGTEKVGDAVDKAGKTVEKVGKKIEQKGQKVEQKGKQVQNINSKLSGIVTIAKDAMKMLKVIKILIIILIASFPFLIIFLVCMVLGGSTDTYNNIDSSISKSNSFNNQSRQSFYYGFGYESSKHIFYSEVEEIFNKNETADLPYVLSAIFYTETRGYNTDYDSRNMDTEQEDPLVTLEDLMEILNKLSKDYPKEIEDLKSNGKEESQKELHYLVGKIARLMKLSDNYTNEKDFEKYLKTKYIVNAPEYLEYIKNAKEDSLDKRLDILIQEIKDNRRLFSDIYIKNYDEEAEEYSNECNGAINNSLVSELQKPTDIKEDFKISFDGNTSFGIREGVIHNGVDLNSQTTGNKAGDSVYAIADGKIEEIGEQSTLKNSGKSVSKSISNYLFLGDSRYEGIESELKNLGTDNNVAAVSSSTSQQWESVTESGSGTVLGRKITLPSSASGVSVMLGVNSISQVSNLQNVLTNLHNRYPNAKIYYNSIYHVGTNYTSGYVTNSGIDSFNEKMKAWCDSVSWATYIDVTSNLNDSSGNLKSEYSSDGLHLTSSEGKNQLVNNIKGQLGGSVSTDEFYANYVKISHEVTVGKEIFKFTSVYRNVDTNGVPFKKGSTVKKGEKIGTIASSTDAHLHFEFIDETNKAIDPTNLFVQCLGSIELVGNTTEEKTWNFFLSKGFTKIATAGITGNFKAEGFNNAVVEYASKAYQNYGSEKFTQMIDDGIVTREEFIESEKYAVPKGWGGYNYNGLTYGYGLAQWTDPGRKANLYDSWSGPRSGTSISDLGLQLNFVMIELDGNYSGVKKNTESAKTPSAAAYAFWHYEVGADKDLRAKYAEELYKKYANK